MSNVVRDLTGNPPARFTNMSLEEVLDEIAQHGNPSLDRRDLRNAASPHLRQLGVDLFWEVSVRTPIRTGGDLYPYEGRRFPQHMNFTGAGRTHREAAANCLARITLYQETGWDHVWDGHGDAARIMAEQGIAPE